MVNPFQDDLPYTSEVTTASVEGARLAPTLPSLQARHFEPMTLEAQSGTVAHWPLWWEDPFEDKGSDDGQFAFTWEDYFCYLYCPGRNLVNTMFFPLSPLLTPPWTTVCSDGKLSRQGLGYDHDATPCPAGIAPPIDILEIGTIYDQNGNGRSDSSGQG
ncbi:MAG: hypothetical protein ACE5GE_00590 [Phycisphaerae bacterium]